MVQYTGLIKSNRSLFQLQFSTSYICGKIFDFRHDIKQNALLSVYPKIDNMQRFIFDIATRNNDTHCESGNQFSSVSMATLAAHITVYNPSPKYHGHT